ncbi:hypothetical protein ACFL3Q_06905 [Planctomycetota bacterium]
MPRKKANQNLADEGYGTRTGKPWYPRMARLICETCKISDQHSDKKLLSAFKTYQTMRMKVLLALGTGLRRGDIQLL